MRHGILLPALALVAAIGLSLAGEGRIPVYETGVVLSENGTYVLTRDIPVNPDGPAITITARRVTLDLNGFTVMQAANTTDPAILITQQKADVLVRNGLVKAGSVGIEARGDIADDPDNSFHVRDVSFECRDVGVYVKSISTVRVLGCTFRGPTTGIKIECDGCGSRAIEGVIEGNTFLQCTDAIVARNVRGFSIAHNVALTESYGQNAFTISDATSVRIQDNHLTHCGIQLHNVRASMIDHNTIEGRQTGVSLGIADDASCRSNRYSNNTIEYVSQDGILVAGAHNYVLQNVTNRCGGFGINFEAGSEGNYYRGNQAWGNGGGSCGNPAGNDACLDGSGHVSGTDNLFDGTLQ